MEENPYKSPDSVEQVQPAKQPAKRSLKITLVEFVVVVAIIIVLIGLLMPPVQSPRHKRPFVLPAQSATP
ncbi:MAG: hypothetical protein K8T91_03135 [Planctomycetes bacterium]|nr:hypothetical protein [Planctomycetota bacterium]